MRDTSHKISSYLYSIHCLVTTYDCSLPMVGPLLFQQYPLCIRNLAPLRLFKKIHIRISAQIHMETLRTIACVQNFHMHICTHICKYMYVPQLLVEIIEFLCKRTKMHLIMYVHKYIRYIHTYVSKDTKIYIRMVYVPSIHTKVHTYVRRMHVHRNMCVHLHMQKFWHNMH